jgi:lipopolysaccharide biosynthesis glycosyltransferase
MKISIPNKESIDIETLKKVLVTGLKNTAGPIPAVFSFEIPVTDILNLKEYEISDNLIEQIETIQFKYIHSNAIKIGNWYNKKKLPNLIIDMKIGIPQTLQVKKIKNLQLEVVKDEQIILTNKINLEKISIGFVNLTQDVYKTCNKLQYRIVYKNSITDIIKYDNKADALYNSLASGAHLCVRHKISNVYKDTLEDRLLCLKEIDKKIEQAFIHDNEPEGLKNLIYYCVYFDKGYTNLLNLSINSILQNSKSSFDIMIITDEDTKKIVETLSFTKKIKPLFFITETPGDGVDASQKKTQIYNWNRINDYKKILFLDCDIVCTKDINKIFSLEYKPGFIYGAKPLTLDYGAHKGVWHGFPFLGQEMVDEMREAKQMPFNAGQFFFINTKRMKYHFNNVNWLMENWSGEYFFEQAFMCYYFGKAYSIGNNLLDNHVTLINTTNDMKYIFNDNTHLIHFIAPPLQADKKIKFIENYFKKNLTLKVKFLTFFRKTFIYALFKKIQSFFHTHSKDRRDYY